MKTVILLVVLLTFGIVLFSCRFSSTSGESSVQQVAKASPSPSPNKWNEYKAILFVDQSFEDALLSENAPHNLYSQAYKEYKAGKPQQAKKSLKQLLLDPEAEVRARLWAWRALRQLGEKPPADIANEVQGVVLEVPVDNSVDALAAYSDGRVRYVNGKGGGAIIWETPDHPRIDPLVKQVMKDAQPVVAKTPAFDAHKPEKNDVIRVSILTYGGIHIVEAREGDISEGHIMGPVYEAGTRLFMALLEENEKAGKKP